MKRNPPNGFEAGIQCGMMQGDCGFVANLVMRRSRLIPILACILLQVSLSSCVSMPSTGEHFVMVVTRIPEQRADLQRHPGLSIAVEQGVTREEVKSGRLVVSGCYEEEAIQSPGAGRRHGYVLLPEGVSVEADDVIEVDVVGAEQGTAHYFGRYVRKSAASEQDYFPYKYSVSGKAFRCGPVTPEGRIRVEVYSTAKYWDYDFAKAEALRNEQIDDSDLEQRRIVIGECSPGVDSWTIWKVRLPPGLEVEVGDYLEAVAGSYEAPRSLGPLSRALRKVAGPAKDEFIQTQGRLTVSCKATARPIVGDSQIPAR